VKSQLLISLVVSLKNNKKLRVCRKQAARCSVRVVENIAVTQSRSRSFEFTRLSRACNHSIVTVYLSCIVSEIKRDIG